MIKLIIFDLDGVLVDTKPLHYFALNKALKHLEKGIQKNHLEIKGGLLRS